MANPVALSIQDLELAFYKAAYPGADTDIGKITSGQGIKIQSAAPGAFGASVLGTGTSGAAPTGGTSLVICAVPTTGTYLVEAPGTAENTQLDNIAVKKNASFITSVPLQNLANTMTASPIRFYVNANATDNITLYVFNNGSAGSIYKGFLNITRVA
jgi:hypothetical protein